MWPFRKVAARRDMWDDAAQRLIDQGVDPEKVRRATHQIKKIARLGGLPEFDRQGVERRLEELIQPEARPRGR